MLQISLPFFLHANALLRLRGYLLRARRTTTAPTHLAIDCSPSCDDPSSLSLSEPCDSATAGISRSLAASSSQPRIYRHHAALDKHRLAASQRSYGEYSTVCRPFLLSSLHTQTFPQPCDAAGTQCHPARPISAGLPWATPRADARCSLAARSRLARSSRPALGELQCSCCMICATPPAPPPTTHHHSLPHPSTRIHSHCKPSCSRYYHLSRRRILFPASDQSLSETGTPPIARSPSRHPPCSSCCHTPSSLQAALLRFPSASDNRQSVWALQCPLQPAGPPAQRIQPFPPPPPPLFPPPGETAVLAVASAIPSQRLRNRAPAKK